MEIKYVYVKNRSQFGKQCIFDDTKPTIEENIYPDPELMKNYIHMNPVDRGTQVSKQFALHEVQTSSIVTKESGMHHIEGGWPKEINAIDEEAVSRYRRRIEKEENWAPKMRSLIEPMERYILQNNAINIYEHYFDDVTPSEILSPSVRTVNVYKDVQNVVRPITHLSWSSDNGERLAAAYCSVVEFSEVLNNLSVYSYIWDIENPNKALMALKASHPSVTIEFHPRDPSMLISGLMSGQVCNWDIRSGNTPIIISHPQFSHKYPANCALWINSKTNSEFFSASTEGTINWWDIRMLQKPVESLIMDLENPLRGDVVKATGVSALQYEITMGTKFMAGLENGLVINAIRKSKNAIEKIATRLECYHGPVISIDRNPFTLKIFLTVGDWTAKIWAEDTREGNLIATRQQKSLLTGGCWSRSRYSVFYVINNKGKMDIFDILVNLKMPVRSTRLCKGSLKSIASHADGKLVAVGSDRGKIYLIESSDALTTNSSNDKNLMTAFLERCSRYEKAVDNRIKETRLAQRIIQQESESSIPLPKSKVKSKGSLRKTDKDKKLDDKKKSEKEKKKLRQKKSKDIWELLGDPELADIERQYFETIDKEMEKYADVAAARSEILEEALSTLSIKESSTKRAKHDDLKTDKDGGKKKDSRKQRALKESTSKDKSGKSPKTEEIVIVRQKHDVPTDARVDDEKIVDETEKAGHIEIMGKKVMENEKPRESMIKDEKIFQVDQKEKIQQWGKTKNIKHGQMGKQIEPENLCDDGICRPEICCRDHIGSEFYLKKEEDTDNDLDDYELKRMSTLIEEMIASSPKNILPTQLGDLPRYTKDEKKMILEENFAPPSLITRTLKEAQKEMRNMEKKMTIKTRRPVDSGHSNRVSIAINKIERTADNFEVIPSTSRVDSIPIKNSVSSLESLKLNEKNLVPETSNDVTKFDNKNCEPIVARFGSKEIRDVIGTKIILPRLRKRSTVVKSNISLDKKKNYPRISAANVNK